jgi:glyoxalase family protein
MTEVRVGLSASVFGADEPAETMGEALALPPDFEPLRARIEPALTPLPDVRQWRPAPAGTEA